MNTNHESRRICTQIESKYCLSDSENSSASGAVSTDPIFVTPVPLGGHQMLCPWNPPVISIQTARSRPPTSEDPECGPPYSQVGHLYLSVSTDSSHLRVQLRNSQCSRRGEYTKWLAVASSILQHHRPFRVSTKYAAQWRMLWSATNLPKVFTQQSSTKRYRLRKKPLNSGGNLDCVTLWIWLGGVPTHSTWQDVLSSVRLIVNDISTSAALVEGCTLLSTILFIKSYYYYYYYYWKDMSWQRAGTVDIRNKRMKLV